MHSSRNVIYHGVTLCLKETTQLHSKLSYQENKNLVCKILLCNNQKLPSKPKSAKDFKQITIPKIFVTTENSYISLKHFFKPRVILRSKDIKISRSSTLSYASLWSGSCLHFDKYSRLSHDSFIFLMNFLRFLQQSNVLDDCKPPKSRMILN